MFVNINNTRIFFDVEGQQLEPNHDALKTKPTLLLIHGTFLDHTCFKPAFSPLSDTCQVIYLDGRGFGRSDLSNSTYWNHAQFADDTIAVMDALGIEQAILLGHSAGCFTVDSMAHRYPERISRNILLNPPFLKPSVFYKNVERAAGAQALTAANEVFDQRRIESIEPLMGDMLAHYFQTDIPADMMARSSNNFDLFMQTLDEILEYDWSARLTALVQPTLVCNGTHDPYHQPDHTKVMRQNVSNPNIEILEFERSGHFVFVDQPEELLRQLTGFIESVTSNET